jgi:predicted Zn-dependent protease
VLLAPLLVLGLAIESAGGADPGSDKPRATVPSPAVRTGPASASAPTTLAGASAVEADAQVKAADELRRHGDFAGALKKVQQVLKQHPKHPQALLLAGTLEGAAGRIDDAIGHLKSAVASMPDNLFARKVYATALMQKGNTALALEMLEPALKARPVDSQAHTLAAQISAGVADFEGAQRYLDQIFKADPDFVPAHQLAARIALARNRPEEARSQLQAVLKSQPDAVEAMLGLASLDTTAGHPAESSRWLERARKTRPDAPEPWMASAGLALRQGHADEAAGYLPRLESLLPGHPVVLALKGQIALAQGRPKDAVEALQAAFGKQSSPDLLVELHQALLANGQQDEAQRRLDAWLDAHPDDLRMRFYAAETAARRQDYAGASTQYRRILEREPDNLLALNDLAQSLQALKDPKALEVAERAYRLKPDSPVAQNTLGSILMSKGNSERGLGLLRDAAGHAPQNPEVRFDYARALLSTGDKARARTELDGLLALKRPFRSEPAAREMLKALEPGS